MPDEHLTSLGKHLATLPIEPTIGKALIYAALLRYTPTPTNPKNKRK
jgi:HrpA-like RNA helicase